MTAEVGSHSAVPVMAGSERPTAAAFAALGILFLTNLMGYVDRAAINILQVPMKAELGLSDTQLGLLIGLAFYLPYILLAAPFARLADQINRKAVLACGLGVWSVMTALTGLAHGMAALVTCRMGVGAGESAAAPPSVSIITEHFPPSRRGAALGIFTLHVPLGSMLGIVLGGMLVTHMGWREVFIVLGGMGMLLLPILLWGVSEPARKTDPAVGTSGAGGFFAAVASLWEIRTLRFLILGIACHLFVTATIQTWSAPFYVRTHGVPVGEVALYLGLAIGIGGAVGSLGGGWLADRLARRAIGWYAWLPAATTTLLIPAAAGQLLFGSYHLSLVAAGITAVMAAGYLAPAMVTTQAVVSSDKRALAVSMVVVVANFFGSILGPLGSGFLSDLLTSAGFPNGLRTAMLVSLAFAAAGGLFFWASGRHLAEDMARARRQPGLNRGSQPGARVASGQLTQYGPTKV